MVPSLQMYGAKLMNAMKSVPLVVMAYTLYIVYLQFTYAYVYV